MPQLLEAPPAPAAAEIEPLSFRERLGLRLQLARQRLREYLDYDSFLFQKASALAGLVAGGLLRAAGKRRKALSVWAALHRRAYSGLANRVIEGWIKKSAGGPGRTLFDEHVAHLAAQPATEVFFRDPARLIGTRILVLKSPGDNEKGVLALDYFFVFPLFAKLFDLREVARRYYLVLEPSWAGYCDPDLLCYLAQDFPVFVQTYEPHDLAFLQKLNANLLPVPTAGNWWVDHRVFRPLPGQRDADVLLIAAWARYKRHDAFFRALAKLRARGEKLKTVLVGYRGDMTKDDVWKLGRYHGVADQLELHERLPAEQVNEQLNRVKVNVLWSRREGFNRAVIEGLFAGTPAIMRQGFNYGYPYPYINPRTGCFASERDLPEKLLGVIRNPEQFAPRAWVMEHMNPQKATAIIDETVGRYARAAGEQWSGGLAEKVTALDAMHYWDERDRERFAADYAFLRACLRTQGMQPLGLGR